MRQILPCEHHLNEGKKKKRNLLVEKNTTLEQLKLLSLHSKVVLSNSGCQFIQMRPFVLCAIHVCIEGQEMHCIKPANKALQMGPHLITENHTKRNWPALWPPSSSLPSTQGLRVVLGSLQGRQPSLLPRVHSSLDNLPPDPDPTEAQNCT